MNVWIYTIYCFRTLKCRNILNKPTIHETSSLLKYIPQYFSIPLLLLFLWLFICNLHALRIFKCVKLKANKLLRGIFMTLKQPHHPNTIIKYIL